MPLQGTKPTAQACDLARNWTSHPLLCGLMLNQLSHTGQDDIVEFHLCYCPRPHMYSLIIISLYIFISSPHSPLLHPSNPPTLVVLYDPVFVVLCFFHYLSTLASSYSTVTLISSLLLILPKIHPVSSFNPVLNSSPPSVTPSHTCPWSSHQSPNLPKFNLSLLPKHHFVHCLITVSFRLVSLH